MRLVALHKAIAGAVGLIPKLNVTWFPSARVSPPLFTMTMPERLEYSQTYGRGGMDSYTLYGTLFVPYRDPEASMKMLGDYCDRDGELSIPRAIESAPYVGVADSVVVTDCEFDYEPSGDDKFMAAMFTVVARGSGAV